MMQTTTERPARHHYSHCSSGGRTCPGPHVVLCRTCLGPQDLPWQAEHQRFCSRCR